MRLEEHYVNDGTPVEHITQAVSKLAEYRRDKADMKMVFEDDTEPVSHRFNEAYANKKYAQAMDAARILDTEFDELWSVMLVLTAYEFNANDEGRAYVDHAHDLLASNEAVRNALDYHVGERLGLDYGRLAVIQPHDDGYAHIAWGLLCNGRVEVEDVYPALEAHLKHCPVAREKDHPVSFNGSDRGKAIQRFKSTPENNVAQGLVTELTKDLVGFQDNIMADTPDIRRKYERLGATLMASNTDQYRPDRGIFQDAVKQGQEEYDHDDRGDYEGIQFEDGGEVYDPSELGGKGGGVTMLDVTDVDPSDDPLPRVS